MTRRKPGQNPSLEESAKDPTHEGISVVSDGPEGYSEHWSNGQSGDETSKTAYAYSANDMSESKAKSYKVQDLVQDIPDGRYTPDSPKTIRTSSTVKESRFGSPLAYKICQNQHDFFKGLLAENTCVLFDQVVDEASTLRERISTVLTNDGSHGHLCFFKKFKHPSMDLKSNEKNNDDSRLELYYLGPEDDRSKLPLFVEPSPRTYVSGDHTVDSIQSSSLSSTARENLKENRKIEVCRVRNSKTGETEYFVMNEGLEFLAVNGVNLARVQQAGPLPDFAVLELVHYSVFWWRTSAALNHNPSLKRKRVSENDEELSRKASKSDADPLPNSQVSPDSKDWLQEYRRLVKLCEERPIEYTSSITELHPPHQHPKGEMKDIDVMLAIGAVWLGLVNANTDFAYAEPDLFSFARSERMVGMRAVKGTNHFLMPLSFNVELPNLPPESEADTAEPLEPVFSAFQRGEEERYRGNAAAGQRAMQKDPGNKNKPPLSLKDQEVQNQAYKGGIGHFVLAIAEKVNKDGSSTNEEMRTNRSLVRLRFMDSASGIVGRGTIRHVARNIVRNSGWLGDVWPCFDANEECWTKVVGQSVNRCGEHTVLNAWAYMLDIPLAADREGALGSQSYEKVRQMIHLALHGQLDSLTIRAWMQHYRYAVDEPLSLLQQNPGLPSKLRNMQTVALNEYAFIETVDDMQAREQWSAMSVPSDGPTKQQSEHAPKVADEVTLPPSNSSHSARSSGIPSISFDSAGSVRRPPPLVPKTWRDALVQELAYHDSLRSRTPRTTQGAIKNAAMIEKASILSVDDVVLGIAPIWEALKRLGQVKFDFTFAGLDVFSPWGEKVRIGAVGSQSRFIMPLFFSCTEAGALEDQREGKRTIRHFVHLVLCVAELVDNEPKTVQIVLYDSRRDTMHWDEIVHNAKRVIEESKWLGVDHSKTEVVYREAIGIVIPQKTDNDTSGLHVILNAFAVMLGIPIHNDRHRRVPTENDRRYATDDQFLTDGLRMVNLALAGFMDSSTIQAFFNVFGYSVEQRYGDPARSVVPVDAVGMNVEKLRRTLRSRQRDGNIALAESEGRRFQDEATATLMDCGLSSGEAWTAMAVRGEDDLQQAMQWHDEEVEEGFLRPEEALSPKTPDRSIFQPAVGP